MSLLTRRIELVDDGVVVDSRVVNAQLLEGRWLAVELLPRDLQQRKLLLEVGLRVARDGIVRRVWAGESDLQEERLRLREAVEPPQCHVADEDVRVRILGKLPVERAEGVVVVLALAVELALLLDEPAEAQGPVPLIEVVAPLEVAVLVLDNVALVEA